MGRAPADKVVSDRLSRALHPGAWWLWALAMATAVSRTTNPLTCLLFAAVVGCVVAFRRSDTPWARGIGAYFRLGVFVLVVRLLFHVLFDPGFGHTVLFTLPQIHLPRAAAGIRIGGEVTLEAVLAATYEGLRLGTLLLCLGAANLLADPRRLLKVLPPALHEVGVAVTVALTIAPQLIESGQRIRRARKLRGAPDRRRVVRNVLVPVLEDALDRSLQLAASMDARGYGRHQPQTAWARRATGALVLAGVVGVCVGVYGTLDGTTPRGLGAPVLIGGAVAAIVGIRWSGRRVRHTVYRPDPWRHPEWLVTACGLGAAVAMIAAGGVDPDNLYPSVQPLRWPTLGWLPLVGALIAVAPAWLAPPTVARRTDTAAREVVVA